MNSGDDPRAIRDLVEGRPPAAAATALREAVEGLNIEQIGWGVLPSLLSWLRGADGFSAGLRVLDDPSADVHFRAALVDFLDAAARTHPDADGYWEALRRLAASPEEAVEIRARALRALRRDDSTESERIIGDVARGPVAELAFEAAHVLANRMRSSQAASSAAALGVRPSAPSIPALRALACSPTAGPALTPLVEQAGTAEALARIVGAAGTAVSPEALTAALVAPTKNDATVEWALRGALVNEAAVVSLADDNAFLEAARLAAGAYEPAVEQRLVELAVGDDAAIAAAAGALLDPASLPDDARLVCVDGHPPLSPAELEQRVAADQPAPRLAPADAQEFSTGFHVGDGLYRDLILPLAHWHAGVYLGFTALPTGLWVLSGINASQGFGWSDAMAFFSATRSVTSPDADVGATIAAMRDELVVAFQEGHTDKTFHGARRAPGVTPEQRQRIAATAASMYAKNIWWTWVDMLDYKFFDWDGSVDDIDESRCDGVVEYAYERAGVRVCGGGDPARWNISQPGTANVENHNDYHNGAYQPGELCPRIQAGDHGDPDHAPAADTTFVAGPVAAPAIQDFAVYGFGFIFVPTIWFRVAAPEYRTVSVRITVRRRGGPWHFLRTEDPYGGTAPPALVGDWQCKQVRANTADKLYGWWVGKTADGADFRGQNGSYDFRLVAVDPAGNVSALATTTLELTWPPAPERRIRCVTKPRRQADERLRAVGGVNDDDSAWRLTLDDAIQRVEAGERFYVEEPTGDRVAVVVAVSRAGRRYMKSEADGDLPNNLLSLPECP